MVTESFICSLLDIWSSYAIWKYVWSCWLFIWLRLLNQENFFSFLTLPYLNSCSISGECLLSLCFWGLLETNLVERWCVMCCYTTHLRYWGTVCKIDTALLKAPAVKWGLQAALWRMLVNPLCWLFLVMYKPEFHREQKSPREVLCLAGFLRSNSKPGLFSPWVAVTWKLMEMSFFLLLINPELNKPNWDELLK